MTERCVRAVRRSSGCALVFSLICASQVCAQNTYVFTVGSAVGVPGDPVSIPVVLDSSAGSAIIGTTLAVCNDPAVATPISVPMGSTVATANGGGPPSFYQEDVGTDGWSVGVVIDLFGMASLPPTPDAEICVPQYQVATAPPTGVSPLVFCNFGLPPVQTVVVVNGVSIPPTLVDGEIAIGGSIETFERGDCNSDAGVNIADAIALLGNLFPTATPAPITCNDACDTNDDGDTNIADAIFLLNSLFGSLIIPEPVNCGPDPTDGDLLDCAMSGGC